MAGVLTVAQLYVVGFVVGTLTVFFDVAYQSYLPSIVAREQLQEGNAKLEISRAGAQVVGPGLAGVLIGIVRAPFAVALDAASFVGSALFLFLIRRPEPPPEPRHPDGQAGPGMRREIAEGLRYVFGHTNLKNIAACTAMSTLFSNEPGLCSSSSRSADGDDAETIGAGISIARGGAPGRAGGNGSRLASAWGGRSSSSAPFVAPPSCRSPRAVGDFVLVLSPSSPSSA